MSLQYLPGFGNEHSTEALPGALPLGRNSPQKCPYGLYAEQLSGTAFTVPRHLNRRSWLYRIRPSVVHSPFQPCANTAVLGSFADSSTSVLTPNQLRWSPPPMGSAGSLSGGGGGEGGEGGEGTGSASDAPVDWLSGLYTMAGSGSAESREGLAIHMYAFTAGMGTTVFSNADGEMLLVPQVGGLLLTTEFGVLEVQPQEIAVIPRGVKFSVGAPLASSSGSEAGGARGYVLEVFSGHFELPELGPLGSNGLANARDFLYPTAAYQDLEGEHTLVTKFGGVMFSALLPHCPFDVVAWHGSYAPYKYDLRRFNTMNTVSYDHPDPSIFTVLTVPGSGTPGCAAADFVIFPPRWLVATDTFRPPWFHRNCMSEFMGMVYGSYDAKVAFQPGGASLHAVMTPHGPDADTVRAATAAVLEPRLTPPGLAFMFETSHFLRVCKTALEAPWRDVEYQKCWKG
jgi:homogentisate 1,2-dioxygenase